MWPPPDGGGKKHDDSTTTTSTISTSTTPKKAKLPIIPIIGASAGGVGAILIFGVGVWLMKRRKISTIEEIGPLWSRSLDHFEEDTEEQQTTFVQLEKDFA